MRIKTAKQYYQKRLQPRFSARNKSILKRARQSANDYFRNSCEELGLQRTDDLSRGRKPNHQERTVDIRNVFGTVVSEAMAGKKFVRYFK